MNFGDGDTTGLDDAWERRGGLQDAGAETTRREYMFPRVLTAGLWNPVWARPAEWPRLYQSNLVGRGG